MVDVSSVIVSLIQLIAPQPCFDEFFVKNNFFDGMAFYILFERVISSV